MTQAPWSLARKTAIVTGGSRGIGRAIAIHLTCKGLSKLAITYISNLAAAESTLDECRKNGLGMGIAIKADLLDPNIGHGLVQQALAGLETPTIDILVNNAAYLDPSEAASVEELTLPVFQKVMQANAFAPISIISATMPHLPVSGGRVINISSAAAKLANPGPVMTYGASKAALDSFTRSLAAEFATDKAATFNTVCVGPTVTDGFHVVGKLYPEGFMEELAKAFTAAQRVGMPQDIAFIVGFLAGEEARWVNGACMSANGGFREVLPALS
ncbi:hypothetical protein AN9232.2 [Aspergillus nidulans FGSC A4]|jgi:3-oxoacyl-[acyl-carrier protein] reductase|uniref:Short chain dehydrogenase asqE n=1 Tax=Emericella nidulans (strain FGSC A4 / ATCC 38163 / CBS 112.46 / NRRL 194 / M139) TaxID=227321 RepID=ASQE_EMENI|nr:hypothetical protein [Aspergillus nidulans FGSC A4]Q5AR48.1 RecName: Full=Short chain dehydrogenase asqE; AltName: Full=4'-methoxyviridicatin/aspoquinolone biosynthesis cluster protein asqE; AltName: Full=Aspoquinolone biosynthesis protein E [Aspergillus nidulans FGSC A4]EAA61523.1 hypothetical protein AN9232.2 [Aspergillus nidulans FGSC A4]CBF82269.1 TPA: conserved hypothetical protein [Aspergillus nidulans FGSC A4]|eukprot:XP_682501.1 hypothetical protein AN9232.2 [Aspergillus nidulans FGSC A4]